MPIRAAFRSVSPYLGAGATVAMLGALVATIYFTWLDIQWIAFLAGILAAAVLSIVSRASRAQWLVRRRTAQLARARSLLQSESVLRRHAEEALASVRDGQRYLDEALPVRVAYVDAGGTVRYHNRALRQALGRSRESIDGHGLESVLGAAAWSELAGPVGSARQGRASAFTRDAGGASPCIAVQCLPHRDGAQVAGVFVLEAEVDEATGSAAAGSDRMLYVDTMARELTDWDNVADRLRSALANDEFCLYSQAIAPLSFVASRSPFHELLVRLREEEENLMPPGTFLPLAEQHGLLPALDRWVVDHLLAWAAADAARLQSTFSVNVSAATVGDPAFPGFLREALARHRVPGSVLCFEIPEGEETARPQPTAAFVEVARSCGCQSALCGFGRNVDSFDHLRSLAVDFLKIDAGIVLRVAASPVDAAKVKAIVRVAHDTRRRTIAECVEDEATLGVLRALGVDYAQGFGVSRPAPLESLGRAAATDAAAGPVSTCAGRR